MRQAQNSNAVAAMEIKPAAGAPRLSFQETSETLATG
jgi:hypothetical protein